MFVVKKKNYLN